MLKRIRLLVLFVFLITACSGIETVSQGPSQVLVPQPTTFYQIKAVEMLLTAGDIGPRFASGTPSEIEELLDKWDELDEETREVLENVTSGAFVSFDSSAPFFDADNPIKWVGQNITIFKDEEAALRHNETSTIEIQQQQEGSTEQIEVLPLPSRYSNVVLVKREATGRSGYVILYQDGNLAMTLIVELGFKERGLDKVLGVVDSAIEKIQRFR